MPELTTRPYLPGDAAAVSDLENTIAHHAGGHGGVTPDDNATFVSTLVRDPAADSRLVFAADGTLVASAMLGTPPESGFRVDAIGGVHPDWRGRGLGRELFGWQLRRAEEIRRAVAPRVKWEVHFGLWLGDADAIRLAERFGLSAVRYWFDMVAPTSGVPSLSLPEGFQVRTYPADDEQVLHEAHMEAFSDHWGYQRRELAEWANLTVRSNGFLPELSLLAYAGSELAGYVLSYQDADPERVYIGQVGVRRPWRRRGLAGALLARVLNAAAESGKKQASLGVDADSPTGAVGVYERAGFVVETRSVTYATSLTP